jgi:hypothetical protein
MTPIGTRCHRMSSLVTRKNIKKNYDFFENRVHFLYNWRDSGENAINYLLCCWRKISLEFRGIVGIRNA